VSAEAKKWKGCPHGKLSRGDCDICSERGIWSGLSEAEAHGDLAPERVAAAMSDEIDWCCEASAATGGIQCICADEKKELLSAAELKKLSAALDVLMRHEDTIARILDERDLDETPTIPGRQVAQLAALAVERMIDEETEERP